VRDVLKKKGGEALKIFAYWGEMKTCRLFEARRNSTWPRETDFRAGKRGKGGLGFGGQHCAEAKNLSLPRQRLTGRKCQIELMSWKKERRGVGYRARQGF